MSSTEPPPEPTSPQPPVSNQQHQTPVDVGSENPGETGAIQPEVPPSPGYPLPPPSFALPRRSTRTVPLVVAVIIAAGSAIVFCLGGLIVGVAGTTSAKPQVSYAPSPYPVVSTITVTQTVPVTRRRRPRPRRRPRLHLRARLLKTGHGP
jgi:hypothetical protein